MLLELAGRGWGGRRKSGWGVGGVWGVGGEWVFLLQFMAKGIVCFLAFTLALWPGVYILHPVKLRQASLGRDPANLMNMSVCS